MIVMRDQALRIGDAGDAAMLFSKLATARQEMSAFAYIALDRRVLGMRHVGGDARDWVDVPVRAVVADALSFDAAGVVMAHNHPGGDPTPSASDRATTRLIVRALDPLGIRLVDHLVLASRGIASFRALGLL